MMADLYVMTQSGLQKANDTFVRMNPNWLKHEKEVVATNDFRRDIKGFDQYLDLSRDIKDRSEDLNVIGLEMKPFVDENGIQLLVGDKPYKLTEWSLGQLSQKIGVPAGYAISMAEAQKYDLFVQNFQSWIDSHVAGKRFLIRTYGDSVRGVLSDSYQTTDTDFVLPLLREGLETTNMNFKIDKAIMNPEYTNMRVVSDTQIDIGGDPHFVGFSFITSDVGRAAMKVEFFVYRWKCSNGMMFGKHGGVIFRAKHTNKNFHDPNVFKEQVVASLANTPMLIEQTKEALKHANAKELKDEDVIRIIDQYKAYTGSGKKDSEYVHELVKERMNVYNNVRPTLWSVANAFTEIAQGFQVDKAERMEDFAGHLLFSKHFAA